MDTTKILEKIKNGNYSDEKRKELLLFWEKIDREEKILEKLPWEKVKKIRNASGKLYPLDWEKVSQKFPDNGYSDQEEFEIDLKELCDSLYEWGLYDPCPKCKTGKKIPVWAFKAYTPFCGCSNYPECTYGIDREGKNIF